MEAHRTAIADWIVRAALDGADEIAVLAGVCERLNALGLSLVRASVANNQLDPTHDARGVRWLRDQGGLEEAARRIDVHPAELARGCDADVRSVESSRVDDGVGGTNRLDDRTAVTDIGNHRGGRARTGVEPDDVAGGRETPDNRRPDSSRRACHENPQGIVSGQSGTGSPCCLTNVRRSQ